MCASLDQKIQSREKSIALLRSLPEDYRETDGIIAGQERAEDATWLNRDQLIMRASRELERYKKQRQSLM